MQSEVAKKEIAKMTITDAVIAELGERYLPLQVVDPSDIDAYMEVKKAHISMVRLRNDLDKERLTIKREILQVGKEVDSVANAYEVKLLVIEQHLKSQRRVVEDDLERKAEEEAQKIADQEAEEAKAEEDRLEAIRVEEARVKKAADDKIAADQKAEDDRLAKIASDQKVEQERIDAENKKLADDKATLQKEKDEMEAEKKAKLDEEERAEREAIEAKEHAVRNRLAKEEQDRKEQEKTAKQEELKPDIEKLKAFGEALYELPMPSVKSSEATKVFMEVRERLDNIASGLMDVVL